MDYPDWIEEWARYCCRQQASKPAVSWEDLMQDVRLVGWKLYSEGAEDSKIKTRMYYYVIDFVRELTHWRRPKKKFIVPFSDLDDELVYASLRDDQDEVTNLEALHNKILVEDVFKNVGTIYHDYMRRIMDGEPPTTAKCPHRAHWARKVIRDQCSLMSRN
jgi:hypothetical protein